MKFVIFGDVCIDKNSVEGAEYTSFGGPAMYMNMVLSKMDDADVSIISNYGNDFVEHKTDIKFIPQEPNLENSLQYQNIVTNGKRRQLAHNHEYNAIDVDESEIEDVVSSADLLIFAPLVPNYSPEYVQTILGFAKDKTTKIVLPQGYFRQFDEDGNVSFREFVEMDEIFPMFDFAIMSDEDYPQIVELAKKWSTKYNTDFIITKGAEGADLHYGVEWMHDDHVINIPTENVTDVVDSTGSGDTFSASFSYMYAKTKDAAKSIAFANKIAGFLLSYTPEQMRDIKLPA